MRPGTALAIQGSATVGVVDTSAKRRPLPAATNFPQDTASVYVLPLRPPQWTGSGQMPQRVVVPLQVQLLYPAPRQQSAYTPKLAVTIARHSPADRSESPCRPGGQQVSANFSKSRKGSKRRQRRLSLCRAILCSAKIDCPVGIGWKAGTKIARCARSGFSESLSLAAVCADTSPMRPVNLPAARGVFRGSQR